MIVMRRQVSVDGKPRSDINYPAGYQDIVSIPKAKLQFRLVYDTKGRFVLHKVTDEEAKFKLCRVQSLQFRKKATAGVNPFVNGQAKSIPVCGTHDGRTIRFVDPLVKIHDTVKVDIATGKIVGHYKFETGAIANVVRGNNIGRIGKITSIEKHPGSFTIVHIKDAKGQEFSTRYAVVSSCVIYDKCCDIIFELVELMIILL
jgi:small subunit ribosomal protein S4e